MTLHTWLIHNDTLLALFDQVWIIFIILKTDYFLQKHINEFSESILNIKIRQYLPHYRSTSFFKSTVVNRALPSVAQLALLWEGEAKFDFEGLGVPRGLPAVKIAAFRIWSKKQPFFLLKSWLCALNNVANSNNIQYMIGSLWKKYVQQLYNERHQ